MRTDLKIVLKTKQHKAIELPEVIFKPVENQFLLFLHFSDL